jgi:hypothetical protein
MAEARGHPITSISYPRYGVTAILVVATIDIWRRYLVFS